MLDVMLDDSTETGTRLAIYIDAPTTPQELGRQYVQTILTKKGVFAYSLVNESLLEGVTEAAKLASTDTNIDTHTLYMVHTQESRFLPTTPTKNITVLGFNSDGTLSSPSYLKETQRRRVEWIGDSIMCGYGITPSEDCFPTIYTSNHAKSYVHLVCQNLSLECFVETYTGVGVYVSYPDPGYELTMPARWKDTLVSNHPLADTDTQTQTQAQAQAQKGGAGNYVGFPTYPWAENAQAKEWKPDAIVINLGTNDLCCEREQDAQFVKEYERVYFEFILSVVERYRQGGEGEEEEDKNGGGDGNNIKAKDLSSFPTLFLGVGPMSNNYEEPVRRIIERLQTHTQTQGLKVNYVDMMLWEEGADGIKREREMSGCQNHPDEEEHLLVAEKVGVVLKEAMGWA
jgi:hypothetical protein